MYVVQQLGDVQINCKSGEQGTLYTSRSEIKQEKLLRLASEGEKSGSHNALRHKRCLR